MPADRVARAAAWLQAWDSHGTHRTATEGDDAGADWLVAEAERLGARVDVESFAVDRVEPVEAFVDIDGIRLEGVKLFDSPDTAPGAEWPPTESGFRISHQHWPQWLCS